MSKSNFDQREQEVDQQQNAAGNIYNVSPVEKDPFEQEATFHNASCMAKTLQIIGFIMIILGFVTLVGSGFMMPTSSETFTRPDETITVIGFGAFIAGIIMTVIGHQMARSEAYKRRLKSQNKQLGKVRYLSAFQFYLLSSG